MANARRPELSGPAQNFYNDQEARKYTCNSRMIEIQAQMAERAIELLALNPDVPQLILDLGCGSGLSGEALSDAGHCWIGLDISPDMLSVALERECSGDLILADMGQAVRFRPGSFDGVISVSALQWLCNADSKQQRPAKRLYQMFSSIFAALRRGGRAVFQFYPDNSAQIELITQQSMKAGFTGGLVVDYPNSAKAKKIFLVLLTGGSSKDQLPHGLDDRATNQTASFERERIGAAAGGSNKHRKFSKQWILDKKEKARKQGKDVKSDSKYTARKRKHCF